jgi:hypothetical protein
VAVLTGSVTAANAIPRGKRPPRRWTATTSAPFVGEATRASQPSTADFVNRPAPVCHPRSPGLQYHGGALVQNPDVFILFWGSHWTDPDEASARAQLVSMFQNIGSSDFACAWREYAVPAYPMGPGTYNGSDVISTDPPSPLDDAVIRQKIQEEIDAHLAPTRTDDRVYVVVPQKGVPVTASDTSTGCGGSNFVFCGYHDSFGTTGAAFRYAVLPYPCNAGNFTCFVDPSDDPATALQVVGSHELTELVTDPDSPPIDSGGWFTAGPGNENADICAGPACTDTLTAGAQTFTVNPAWSNLAKGCVTGVSCSPPPIECTDGSPGVCVPGTGRANTCEFEWLADPNLTLVARTQIPGRTISCTDGRAFCDADGLADGKCTFRVAACLNSGDPRLACTPAAVTSITLTNPSPASSDPVKMANAGKLLGALATVDLNSTGTTVGNQITYTPEASTPDACTTYLSIVVPAGTTRKLAVTLQTSAGVARNRLQLKCAATLP